MNSVPILARASWLEQKLTKRMDKEEFHKEALVYTTRLVDSSSPSGNHGHETATFTATFFLAWMNGTPARLCFVDADFSKDLRTTENELKDGKRMFINKRDLNKIGFISNPRNLDTFMKKSFGTGELSQEDVFQIEKEEVPSSFLNVCRLEKRIRQFSSDTYVSYRAIFVYMKKCQQKKWSLDIRDFFAVEYFVDSMVAFMNTKEKHTPSSRKQEPETLESDPEQYDKFDKEGILDCLSREQIETHLILPVECPEDFPLGYIDPNMVPDYVGLNFSMYEVPSTYQTMKNRWYVKNWDVREKAKETQRDGRRKNWTEANMLETLYKNANSLVLARWRSMFHKPKPSTRKRGRSSSSTDNDDQLYILAIRSDDLQRSGLCHSVNESMKIVTERILCSSDQEAISYLFPTMCRSDVVFLKSYFSGSRSADTPKVVRAPFTPKRRFRVPKTIFAPEGREETEEEQAERMKEFGNIVRMIKDNIAYTEHLRLLTNEDKNAIAEYSYTKMKQARERKKTKSLMRRGKISDLINLAGAENGMEMEMETETETETDTSCSSWEYEENEKKDDDEDPSSSSSSSSFSSVRGPSKKRNKGKERVVDADIGHGMDEDFRLSTYMKYMRNVPSFSVRFLKQTKAMVPNPIVKGYTNFPYINMNMFEHQFNVKDINTHTNYKSYVLPRETYRLIPIWLLPMVLDVSMNDLLSSMIPEHSIYGLCYNKLHDNISNMLSTYGAESRRYYFKDTDRISPFSRLRYSDMLRACQKLLETTALWNEAYHKDSIFDLRRQLEQARKYMYHVKFSSDYRISLLEEEIQSMRDAINLPCRQRHALVDRRYDIYGSSEAYSEHDEEEYGDERRVRRGEEVLMSGRGEEIEALYGSTSNSSSLSFMESERDNEEGEWEEDEEEGDLTSSSLE